MVEFLSLLIVLPAVVVGLFAVLFGLSRVASPEWIRRIGGGAGGGKFKLWHIMAAVLASALLLHAASGPPSDDRILSVLILALWVLAWFARAWCNEFIFLMGLRDDDFTGRNDKLIWAIVLVALAPFGLWLFRTYRLARWPGPKWVSVTYSGPESESQRGMATQPV
jgi:hypothetical protein